MKAHFKERKGSVLMEFLLVCPLYFALLGGILKIGSLSMTTHKAAAYDAYAAIGYGEGVEVGAGLKSVFNSIFSEDGNYLKTPHVVISEKDSFGNTIGNRFQVQQSSGTKVELESQPVLWSLIGATRLFAGSRQTPDEPQLGLSESYDRQFVIKVREKKENQKENCSYDRSLSAEEIVEEGVWYNSAHDDFPMLKTSGKDPIPKGSGENFYERSAALCDFSE